MSKTSAANTSPLPWEQALSVILDVVGTGTPVSCELYQARGKVCAADVGSTIHVPPFDNSSMDGFAVRAEDVSGASGDTPVMLRVIGEAPAGRPFLGTVGVGEAVEIMTGAPLPDGADAVVRVEDTTRRLASEVSIWMPAKTGTAIRRAGADTAAGELVIGIGQVVTAGHIALAASCGIAAVPVYRAPRIALAVGGDEVIAISEKTELGPGQIFDSNSPMLMSLMKSWGMEPEFLGRMPDQPDAMLDFFRRGLEYDFLVTVGGVSMGEHDYVRQCLSELGAHEHFWKINQQPGGPMLFAKAQNTLIFGLPGNPVSCYVCADIYVHAAVRKACGRIGKHPRRTRAVLVEPLRKPHGKVGFVRCALDFADGRFMARSTGAQDSNRIRSIAAHRGYILFPEERRELLTGDEIEVLITDPAHLGEAVSSRG